MTANEEKQLKNTLILIDSLIKLMQEERNSNAAHVARMARNYVEKYFTFKESLEDALETLKGSECIEAKISASKIQGILKRM